MLPFNIKKLISVLSLKTTLKIYFLYTGLIILTFLEVVGLGTIPFILSEIIGQNLINNFFNINFDDFIRKYFHFDNTIIFLSIFILLIFFVKFLYILIINFYELSIIREIKNNLSVNLLKAYMSRPYVFFLNQNSSILAKNVLKEVDYAVTYIASIFLILKEIQLILVILIFLLFIEPEITIIGFSFVTIISLVFYKITDKKLKYVAIDRIRSLENLYQASFEIFGAIKEIKIYKKFQFYIKKFEFSQFRFENNILIANYIKKLPRVFFEFFSVLIISVTILMFHLTGKDLITFIPFLSLIVVTLVRLMPSFSSLSSAITHIKSYKNSFDEVTNEILKLKQNQSNNKKEIKEGGIGITKTKNRLISLTGVSFNYPATKRGSRSIFDINLDIDKGEMIGFLGKSGSGKSTLMNIILKLIEPDKGGVDFNFETTEKNNQHPVSFVPQDIYLLDDTIRNNIAFGINDDFIDDEKVISCLKDTEMWDYVKKHPSGLDLKVGERGIRLSGGEKQRIGLARALYSGPQLLILDEATSSLDSFTEKKIAKSIKKLKHKLTIIIVSHRLSTLDDCDKVFYIENGTIKDSGSLSDLLLKNKDLN